MQLGVGCKFLMNPKSSSYESGYLPFLQPDYTKKWITSVLCLPQYISSMIDIKKCSQGLFFFPGKTKGGFPLPFVSLSLLVFPDCIKMLHSWKPWAITASTQWLCISLHLEIFLLPGGGRTRWPPKLPSIHHFWDPLEHRQSQEQSLLHTIQH